MATFDRELLDASKRLLGREAGQRGRLAGARVRRSISTSYYALFHFLIDEATSRLAGPKNLRRRRILARAFTHAGIKTALDKVKGKKPDSSIAEFLRFSNATADAATPVFMRQLAASFADAQAKRHDADYDLNKPLSETDARLLHHRVQTTIAAWRAARKANDRDFKEAICLLLLLKGQVRRAEN